MNVFEWLILGFAGWWFFTIIFILCFDLSLTTRLIQLVWHVKKKNYTVHIGNEIYGVHGEFVIFLEDLAPILEVNNRWIVAPHPLTNSTYSLVIINTEKTEIEHSIISNGKIHWLFSALQLLLTRRILKEMKPYRDMLAL